MLGGDSSSGGLAPSGQVDPALAEIVEEITRRVQSGEEVDPEEYARSNPEWAALLRSLLLPLRELAQLKWTMNSVPPSVPLPAAVVLPATFGDFAVRREIGRGGMGIVYEAEQISLSRRVALKILSAAAALDAQSLRRFQIEAQAAACLNHEHIVPVHAVGSHNDVPFYAMHFIEGASLAGIVVALRRLRDGEPSPVPAVAEPGNLAEALALDLLADRFGPGRAEAKPERTLDIRNTDYVRAVVRLAAQVAEALDHAHEQGILHRDIKPANLLLDHAGKLWVTDFGLARFIGSATLTATGDLAGTLRYMSPEQVLGKRALIDRRSDIYSLGATLYELLTLEPAIDGLERWEILARIDYEEPRPIRRLNPAVPLDLATIVAKAMAKDISARYLTAQDLGDDLNRFLEGRPVKARRASAWQQGIRWSRRNPVVAALLTALVLVFLAGFAAVTMQWRRAEAEANRANQTARAEAEARAAESRLRIQAQVEAAARVFDRALELARRGDVDQGLLWMAEALRRAPSERPELGRMARTNLTAWTGQVPPLRAILEHHAEIHQAVFRSDGRAVLTGSLDGTAQIWDTSTGQPIGPPLKHGDHGDQVLSVAFSPNGRLILTGGSDGKVRLWDAATGKPAATTLLHGASVWYIAFSPDGRLFMTFGGDHRVRLWNSATGRPVGQPVGHGEVANVDFSPDGRFLLTGGTDGVARLWDVATGQPTGAIFRHDDTVTSARFSPDQRLIATGSKDGTSRLWNAATGQPIGPILHHGTANSRLVFSPNGKLLLATGLDGTARLWDTATGQPIGPTLRHASQVWVAAFSPDGKLLLTGSLDHTARLWDIATGQSRGSPLRHRLPMRDVSFSPDGKLVLTASADGTAKLWEVGTGEIVSNSQSIEGRPDERNGGIPTPRPGVPFGVAAFSPDRDRVLLGSNTDGLARLVETDTGQPVGPPITHRWSWVRAVAFSPDGHHLATTSHDRGFDEGGSTSTTCQIWDAATARPSSPLLPHINYAAALAFRPDGKVLATGDYSGAVHLWDVETGTTLRPPLRAGSIVLSLAYSPDGRILAAGTAEPVNQVVLWDLAAGVPRGEPLRFKRSVIRLAFSPDGSRLAVGSNDTTARLVDVATGRAIREPLCHADTIRGLTFSPDGQLLLTVNSGWSGTSAARLWDVATGQPASPALAHPSAATGAVAFSSDGRVFATGCEDGSVHLWDVASATPIGPPRMLRGRVLEVTFRPDGRTLLAVDDRGDVRSWPVPVPSDEPVERLIQRLQVRSGLELDAAREVVVLDPETWRRHREELDDPPPTSGLADDFAWHEASARDAEAVGDSFAARWHLERMISARSGEGLLRARHAQTLLMAGDPKPAQSEMARAIALGPRDRILDWLVQRAEDFRVSGRPHDALRLLDQVIAAGSADWLVHARRAEVLAALGRTAERETDLAGAIERGADIPFLMSLAAERSRVGLWRAAAELYDRAIAQGTVPYEVWEQAALAHLEIDDQAGYRRVCQVMRSRHPAEVPERWVGTALVNVCILGPGGVGDDGKARSWAENLLVALSPDRKELRHAALSMLGGILYRSGRFRAATDRIHEGIATENGEFSFEDAALLAMAYHECGDHAKSREMLAKVRADEPARPASEFWDAQARRLLRREAEQLIFDRPFPADPFAR